MKTAFIVEDDPFLLPALAGIVEDLGLVCSTFSSVSEIEGRFEGSAPDVMIVDLALPVHGSNILNETETKGGSETGIPLLRLAKRSWPDTRFGLITGKPSSEVRQWCMDNGVEYLLKPIQRSTLERFLSLRSLRSFVVHGRNLPSLEKTKKLLEALKIEPVVLMERPNKGRTVIEKFEEISESCDCAIVVMSPDDVGRLADVTSDKEQSRIRQNVLFELGYFCGNLGRRSGSVILIEFGNIEIPSDLAGVVLLDGNSNFESLKQQIESELSHLRYIS